MAFQGRVRSDAGILSIAVAPSSDDQAPNSVVGDSPVRRRCTRTLFPAILRPHPRLCPFLCVSINKNPGELTLVRYRSPANRGPSALAAFRLIKLVLGR